MERLDAKGYARRVGVSTATAYRHLEALAARQSDPSVLRVDLEPAQIGSGAVRMKRVVLWPDRPANDNTR